MTLMVTGKCCVTFTCGREAGWRVMTGRYCVVVVVVVVAVVVVVFVAAVVVVAY